MKALPFKKSKAVSIGVELEYQIIDRDTFALASRAIDIFRCLKSNPFNCRIKPEINQSMIEINTSIHLSAEAMLEELRQLQSYLIDKTSHLNIGFCGGGIHPEQKWISQKVFPRERYIKIAKIYGYLAKQASVFGQHVHVGCANAEDALYLTHAFARYIPQFIAISASSPFYEGTDTGYFSTRSAVFNGFPMSRVMPFLQNWQEFTAYFYKMRDWGIIESMKDVYWDVRPKPEFGTVEIRIFDTPLKLEKAVMIAAYVQSLALYLLAERPFKLTEELYFAYQHNRFQASRYGLEAKLVDTDNNKELPLMDDIMSTEKKIKTYSAQLGCEKYVQKLMDEVNDNGNDAMILRNLYKEYGSFPKIISIQYQSWLNQ
ncbi:YbdK family carboxylate-amine ligase [Legionella londiniensis]|uniref:Putative glutamate--cysteine ligase 2 n=1 Tax=Legionella londiniensis TaxID=45068 RepID=A0A0W0VMI9_9GAMM|nr:YbdK family carboxylate-amine ligase [Legionella londiniensis]KTD21276.1 carboxylate-amine ligase [Legionella londiniensis]STX93302.1 carboxylate-amine ligase [Legionella londiniensis]